jgi:FkbM family methyltransferase
VNVARNGVSSIPPVIFAILLRIRMKHVDHLPILFRTVKGLRHNYRLRQFLGRFGAWKVVAPFPFHKTQVAYLPLYEKYCWAHYDMGDYHRNRTDNFARAVRENLHAACLIDCGCNLGLYSAQILHKVPSIFKALLFEINPEYVAIAQKNVMHFGRRAEVIHAAVSNYHGKARIVEPAYHRSPEAFFIEKADDGEVIVNPLDDYKDRVGKEVALKIDVEGEELAVLEGANDLLESVDRFVIMIEFNRTVMARTGTLQRDLVDAVASIRPVKWLDAERFAEVDPAKDVFEQTGGSGQCDLIAISL